MAGRTDESLRLVDFTAGGRPFGVLDLEDGQFYTKRQNTLQIRPGQRTAAMGRLPGRYGGTRTVEDRLENAEVAWTVAVIGSTVNEALDKANALLARLDGMAAGRMIEWRARDASYPTFLEVRGAGVATPLYDADLLEQERAIQVELAVPVEPVGRMARMDICDTFDVPGDAAVVATNLLKNPGAEVNATDGGWAGTSATIGRSTGNFDTGAAAFTVTSTAAANASLRNSGGRFPASAGLPYSAAGVFKANTTPRSCRMYLDFYDGTGTRIGSPLSGSDVSSTTTGFTRATALNKVAPAGTVSAQVIAEFGTGALGVPAIGEVHYVDSLICVQADTVPGYFDGDSHAAAWTGDRHNSTSNLYDRSTRDDYTMSSGSFGSMIVANGALKQGAGADGFPGFGLNPWHTARGHEYADVMAVSQVTITAVGADVSYAACPGIKQQENDNRYIWATNEAANLRLYYFNGTANVSLGAVAHGLTLAVGTTFWVRVLAEGNVIRGDIWATPPTPTGTPAASVTLTLDSTTTPTAADMGATRVGRVSPRAWPTNASTRVDIERFEAYPFTYRTHVLPEQLPLGGPVPGDAPALVDVEVTPSGGAAAPVWALLGWARRPTVANLVWNGDFEDDTNGVLPQGWRATGLQVNNAPTSFLTVNTQAKYGTRSGETVTPATTASGPEFRIYRPFRKGVTYTARAWMRSTSQTTPVQLVLWGPTGPESNTSTAVALSPTWTEHVLTWTPTVDHDYAVLASRTNAATATTFQIDGVKVYEGATAPALATQDEGRGGYAPFGIVPAESCDTGDLSGWAITADANYRHGQGLKVTASGAGTAAAQWFIDPALLAPDDFTLREVDVEVFAKVDLASTLVSPKLTLSARPEAGTAFGAERYSTPFLSAGKLVTKPSSGSAFRTVRLGIVTMLCDPTRPGRWKLRLAGSWALGSTGNFGVDELYLSVAAKRAAGTTGKANDASYPKFVQSTAETTKTVRSDLSGLSAKPPAQPFPDSGLGGEPIEFPPGDVDVLVKLASAVPDDPTADTTSEQKEHTATVHFAVWPRVHLLRGS